MFDQPDRRPPADTATTSEYTNIDSATLALWRKRGEGPPYFKSGRIIRYDLDAVDRWLEDNTVRPQAS